MAAVLRSRSAISSAEREWATLLPIVLKIWITTPIRTSVSAVATARLLREGADVVGVHLRTGVETEGESAGGSRSCCGADDARDARAVAARLKIPFYVVDVGNPKKLKKLGELKIPGVSRYLHPWAPNQILGIGSSNGARGGLKVSVFDVSNVKSP